MTVDSVSDCVRLERLKGPHEPWFRHIIIKTSYVITSTIYWCQPESPMLDITYSGDMVISLVLMSTSNSSYSCPLIPTSPSPGSHPLGPIPFAPYPHTKEIKRNSTDITDYTIIEHFVWILKSSTTDLEFMFEQFLILPSFEYFPVIIMWKWCWPIIFSNAWMHWY